MAAYKTDYKQLCAELLAALENEGYANWVKVPDEDELCLRARAALEEPEPEWPTDEEIMDLMPQQMRDDLAAAARAMSGFDPDNIKAASVFRIILNRHSVDHARAALARWGRPAPIPVTERLPGPEDCDAEGRCWWWYPPVPEQTYGYWAHEDDATDRAYEEWPSAWLPAHALPLPEEVV